MEISNIIQHLLDDCDYSKLKETRSFLRTAAVLWYQRPHSVRDPSVQRFPVCHWEERSHTGVPPEWRHRGFSHGGPILRPAQSDWRTTRPCGGDAGSLTFFNGYWKAVLGTNLAWWTLMVTLNGLCVLFPLGVRPERFVKGWCHSGHRRRCLYLQGASVSHAQRKVGDQQNDHFRFPHSDKNVSKDKRVMLNKSNHFIYIWFPTWF